MNFHKIPKNGRYVNKLTGGAIWHCQKKRTNIEGCCSIFTLKLLRKGILEADHFHGSSLA